MSRSSESHFPTRGTLWLLVALFVGSFCYVVWTGQDRFLFHPRPYSFAVHGIMDVSKYQHIAYQANGVEQTAYYLPPRKDASKPGFIWVMFHGNASLALEWHNIIGSYPDPHTAFFLVDYPGYGKNQGMPSKDSILSSATAALESLIRYQGGDQSEVVSRIGVVGYSLGSAAALDLANRAGIEHVVLLSPFSTMQKLVCGKLLPPFCYLLRHRFDNIGSLKEALEASERTQVVVLHGKKDSMIPWTMSRDLEKLDPGRVQVALLADDDHNSIIGKRKELFAAMTTQSARKSPPELELLARHDSE